MNARDVYRWSVSLIPGVPLVALIILSLFSKEQIIIGVDSLDTTQQAALAVVIATIGYILGFCMRSLGFATNGRHMFPFVNCDNSSSEPRCTHRAFRVTHANNCLQALKEYFPNSGTNFESYNDFQLAQYEVLHELKDTIAPRVDSQWQSLALLQSLGTMWIVSIFIILAATWGGLPSFASDPVLTHDVSTVWLLATIGCLHLMTGLAYRYRNQALARDVVLGFLLSTGFRMSEQYGKPLTTPTEETR